MEDFLQDPYEESANLRKSQDFSGQSVPANDFNTNYRNHNSNIGSPQNGPGFDSTNDPLIDQLNLLGSPLQQSVSIDQSLSGDLFSDFFDPNHKDLTYDLENDLDPLKQIDNAKDTYADNYSDSFEKNFSENMFLLSQYFSPNTRAGNFSLLNAIAEDGNNFTPNISRHGSVSVSVPHESNSYLSPKKFMSPNTNAYEGSFDTLTSPYLGSYSGSYLNSPPPMTLNQSMNVNVPSAPVHTQSPQLSYTELNVPARRPSDAGTKQLTQEEKIKRRREFHNAVERRRRDLIKEKIKALGLLVPPSLLSPQLCAVQALSKPEVEKSPELSEVLSNIKVKDTKPNKAIILRESVVYVRHLQKVSEQQKRRRQVLELQIMALESGTETSKSSPGQGYSEDDFFKDILNT